MTRYIQKKDVETVQMDDEWLVMDISGYTITRLNQAGGVCWSLLSSPLGKEELAQSMMDQYTHISLEAAMQDVESFFQELLRCGLIEPV